jgi:hypothetical protein
MRNIRCPLLVFFIALWCCDLGSGENLAPSITLKISKVSSNGVITVEMVNSSGGPIRVWDEDNSWGAAHWRVFLQRGDQLQVFYENPRRIFRANMPTFRVIEKGEHVERKIDLNGGNWCGFSYCSSVNEPGFGGKLARIEPEDTVIVVYDVPITYDPEARKYKVWDGVTASTARLSHPQTDH